MYRSVGGAVGFCPGDVGCPGDAGSCSVPGVLHVVCVKHDSPKGHSLLLPDGQGHSHEEASSKLVPHMNESLSLHEVYGKQNVWSGQSLSSPLAQGNKQFDDAWFQVVPQKYESLSSHGVLAKHEYSGPSSAHSILEPLGHGRGQEVAASG